MTSRIVVINGHPDSSPDRLTAGLVAAYVGGAAEAGHQIRRFDVGAMEFPLIRSQAEFESEPPAAIREVQAAIRWANHVVIVFPLWLGAAPAVFKGFLEQVFRYGFAVSAPGESVKGLLKGRSVRVVVTMGMPAAIFRWAFGAHGLKSLERGLLWMSGLGPIRRSILGGVEASAGRRSVWLGRMRALGAAAR